jgi:hypothetical protein
MGLKNTGKRELGTMGTTALFKPTAVQKKALALLKGRTKHILLAGGSRSGKTVLAIICRALRFAGSRHLMCRYRAKDVRLSVPQVLRPNLKAGAGRPVILSEKNGTRNRNHGGIYAISQRT